ncbi:cystathionine gamma-lyase cys3 [Madurella fahalii]|uniref:Cystathionine gamma-lyase cys3 n=1 Tax=Madurella fahalii TaxID=1157608 RepID=A0ABQ0G751_9PEZI
MSFSGRRGVNVSQYLRDLNVQEPAVEETFITDEDLAKDLALFTNTQFYDFETGQNTDYQAPPVKPETTAQTQTPTDDVTSADPILGDFAAGFDFMSGDFSFGDFSTYTSPTIPAFPDPLGGLQPIQPNPPMAYPPPVPQHHQPGYVSSVPRRAGEKRKAETLSPPGRMLSIEEQSRLAAEEDKRKRNTAASARFRIKKKQREQALEKSAKEMTEKVTMLEGRISALETENKWLKSLVTEKHGAKEDMLEKLLKEFSAQEAKKDGGDSRDSFSAASSTTAVDDSERRPLMKKD